MNSNLKEIYLDANATTPVLPQAIVAVNRTMSECFGNPSSTHCTGLRAKALLDNARNCAMRVLGAGQGRIVFTSGATEGIQTAILSVLCDLRTRRERGEHAGTLLLYGATEHKAVPENLAHWNHVLGLGCRIEAIPVDANGRHDLAFLRAYAPHAALVCTMAANNETGLISDLAGIENTLIACANRPFWLVDSVQALGKLALNLAQTRIDYASFSGHKLYAPKGTGLLYVRAGAPFTPLLAGGGQESGYRSGTENMTGIAALGAVLEALEQGEVFRDSATLYTFREQLIAALTDALPGLVFNTPLDFALPTTLNFSVPDFPSKELLDLFDAAGIRVSSGSACGASKALPSYVLQAMGISEERAASAIRLSFGPATTADDIAAACSRIKACGIALRRSCRIPIANKPDSLPQNGLMQLVSDGACTWLLADAASRTCVIIDPLIELSARLEAYVRCQDYRVLAVLDTHAHAGHGSARNGLVSTLADRMLSVANDNDVLGWPGGADTVVLANGEQAQALTLGHFKLARTTLPAHTTDSVAYLVGVSDADRYLPAKSVRYAFTGDTVLIGGLGSADFSTSSAADPHASLLKLAAIADDLSLICPAHDYHNGFVTTLAAERRTNPLLSRVPALQEPLPIEAFVTEKRALDADLNDEKAGMPICGASGAACIGSDSVDIHPDALPSFLRDKPDALLVDVREAYEHGFSNLHAADTCILNVPLSCLAEGISLWLQSPKRRPLIFFCRSGKRGMAAASCLRRLGYENAWNLSGGIALSVP